MSPRTSRSRLLLALAGMAGIAGLSAWFAIGDGTMRTGIDAYGGIGRPTAVARGRVEPEELFLVAVRPPAESRASSIPPSDVVPECLEDGSLSISGRVVDDDGLPVAEARVAILGALHEADALQVRGATITDEEGRFDVRTAKPGDIWLTAFTPGARPATYRCATEAGFMDLAEPLHLERGVVIAGRVSADDDPLDHVELEVVGPWSSQRVRIGEYLLIQVGGRLEWGVARCMTDADGHWEFHGLAPGEWIVRPRAFRCPRAVFPPGALPAEKIEAPASDVELRIPAARLAVTAKLDGEPLAWAEIEVEYRGLRSSRRADAQGRLELDVSPSESLTVVMRAPGRQAARSMVTGPRRGERRELEINAGPPAPPDPGPREPAKRSPPANDTTFRPGI